MRVAIILVSCLCLACASASARGKKRHSVAVANLKCEYRINPLGIDVFPPRLSWQLRSALRGQKPTAYQVLVASSPDQLEEGKADLWDSGKVVSDQSIHVDYAGRPLRSRTRCFWKVCVWDRNGEGSDWSDPAMWTMGLLKPEDWRAKWISTEVTPPLLLSAGTLKILKAKYIALDGKASVDVTGHVAGLVKDGRLYFQVRPELLGGDPARGHVKELRVEFEIDGERREASALDFDTISLPEPPYPVPGSRDAPHVRQTFTLDAAPESALAYVNVRGYCELYVNGQKAGDDVLSPAVTGLEKHLLYKTYDISALLKPGSNCVGLWQGHGWCQSQGWKNTKPLIRAQLEIAVGGKKVVIGTDRTWTCASSGYSRLGDWKWNGMGGERIDARREIRGWSEADCPADEWTPVREVPVPPGEVVAQPCSPNRIGAVIPLAACTALAPDTWELDFGVNLTGWVRLRLPMMKPGQRLTLRYADKRLQTLEGDNTPAGRIKPGSPWTVKTPEGPVCYQTYNQIDEFISAGRSSEQFCSKFNYHGFRYVIVQGLASEPAPGDAEALLVESDLETAGSFACSNDLFNRIHKVNLWTLRCLSLGGQTVDCPHRERLGYGDGQTAIEMQIMNRDAAAFYSKWAVDWMAAQKPTGQFPHTAPFFIDSWGGPGWGGLGCVLPWKVHLYYGDRRLLERAYEPMRRYAAFLESKCTDDILRQNSLGKGQFLGDWVPPGRGMDTEKWPGTAACELFNNGYRLYLCEILERSARALGKVKEADQYAAQIERIRPLIHSAFYDARRQQYVTDEQAYQVMPLMTEIVPESLRETVQRRLEDIIMVKNRGHLDTGMLGTYFLIQYLQEAGRNDLLYTIYSQKTYPGWGYMLSQGATTFWEQWNGYWSQIHSCFAGPGSWFYQGLAGIRPDPAAPGFKKIIIKPAVVGDLTWVKCHHDSMYGRIVSNWKRERGTLTMDVVVPPSTTASVYVPVLAVGKKPAKDDTGVTESGKPVSQAQGVKLLRMENGAAVYEIGSGRYCFKSRSR